MTKEDGRHLAQRPHTLRTERDLPSLLAQVKRRGTLYVFTKGFLQRVEVLASAHPDQVHLVVYKKPTAIPGFYGSSLGHITYTEND